jgi:predicted NACHT family NTPase
MMMAPDSSQSPPGRIDDASLEAVRLALRAYLRDPNDTSALQASLLALSTEASARDILPEQLLVSLKELWNTLPEVRAMTDAGEQVRLLQRVVTMCIREYYDG